MAMGKCVKQIGETILQPKFFDQTFVCANTIHIFDCLMSLKQCVTYL